MPVTAGAFIASVCINGSLGLLCFSAFALLRQWRVTAKFYKPKRYVGAENASRRRPAPLAAELPAGLLSWIRMVWCYPEPAVIDLCGLDVAAFFRLLQLGVRLFCFISVWSLLVCLPVNYAGGYLNRKKHRPGPNLLPTPAAGGGSLLHQLPLLQLHLQLPTNFTDAISTNLDLFTLSNVPPGSSLMWVHVASVYLITFVALKLLWDLSRDIAFKRAAFLAVAGADGIGSSVLVTDLPGLDWGTPVQRLQLSWLTWLLPAGGLFGKRGFEHYRKPALGSRSSSSRDVSAHRQQQQQPPWDDLQQPLLPPQAAGAPAGPDAAGRDAAAGSSAGPQQQQQQQHDEQDDGEQQIGPPIVREVWAEAVDFLRRSGGDVQAMVEQEMRRVYGEDSVAAVSVVHDTSRLAAAAARFTQLHQQFEDVLDWYQHRLGQQQQQLQNRGSQDVEAGQEQPQSPQQQQLKWQQGGRHDLKRKTVLVVGPRYGAWGIEAYGLTPTQVDALEFYPAVLQQQLSELQQLQEQALQLTPRPAAIVTFKGQLMATLAAASLHSYDETAWTISPAPGPGELLWRSLGLRNWELSLRWLAVWAAFWALVVFYAPLVALIQAPINMDNLTKIPLLASLLNLPLVSSILQGFLPSLVLLIFLALLPYTLLALISWAGVAAGRAAEDSQLTGMFFIFQLFAVFIFSFVSGTALSQLQALLDDPHKIVTLLGISAPQQAGFFSTWILLLGLSRTPLQLLRLPQLVLYLLRLQLADSPRQRRRLWADQEQLLGYTLPLHTLVLLLGLVFCVAAPIIAPVTLLYFVSASVCQRYQWLYVFRHPYEGAGMLWRQVFSQVLVGVYFFVAVMGCLLGIKRFEYALLLLPLAMSVLIFHVLAGRLLERPLTLPSSREAAAMDHYLQQAEAAQAAARARDSDSSSSGRRAGGNTEADAAAAALRSAGQLAGLPDQAGGLPQPMTETQLQELYLEPCLKISWSCLQPLLDEAAEVQQRLAELGC